MKLITRSRTTMTARRDEYGEIELIVETDSIEIFYDGVSLTIGILGKLNGDKELCIRQFKDGRYHFIRKFPLERK